jgi:hypothetical protein
MKNHFNAVIAQSPPGINFAKQSRDYCGLGGYATRLLRRVAPRNDSNVMVCQSDLCGLIV